MNRYISGCRRLLQNTLCKPNTRTSNILEQPEIWPGWCTVGVRVPHIWRPRSASLGPADTLSPFLRRDFLELAVCGGDAIILILIVLARLPTLDELLAVYAKVEAGSSIVEERVTLRISEVLDASVCCSLLVLPTVNGTFLARVFVESLTTFCTTAILTL